MKHLKLYENIDDPFGEERLAYDGDIRGYLMKLGSRKINRKLNRLYDLEDMEDKMDKIDEILQIIEDEFNDIYADIEDDVRMLAFE